MSRVDIDNWKDKAREYHNRVCPEIGTKYENRYLALELGGEVGELLNIIKKLWRGNHPDPLRLKNTDLPEEIADVYILLHLLAENLFFDLDELAANKVEVLFGRLDEQA